MYNNVLAAIDLTEGPARKVLENLKSVADEDARLRVLHVVEPQYVQYSFDPTFTGSMIRSLEAEAIASAERRVYELAEPFGIDESDLHVVMGRSAAEIRDFARSHQCDVIVMGTHGRHGWQRLLGSTANSVLHDTPVDVYMCNVNEESN